MSADRYTATLTELRPKELMVPLPARLSLEVTTAGFQRTVDVDGPTATVGANPGNAVCVEDESVSGIHCELRLLEDGRVLLRDLGSKNGTWIDSTRVGEALLRVGARFAIGKSTMVLVAVEEIDVPVSTVSSFGELHGRGAIMGKLFAQLRRLASVDLDALIVGETGTGKDLVARGIHEQSERRDGPFVVVDCTNLNEGVAESILFGHCRGSFTSAVDNRPGLLEEADGGTLFLDEIGELPPTLQPKLLRALENRETRRIGESRYRKFDARVIAATNRDLAAMVCRGEFREDLYFRLAPIMISIPALRERNLGNIAMLADLFISRCSDMCETALRFEKEAYEALDRYPWPGNVRELYGVVRSTAMMAEDGTIGAEDLLLQDNLLSLARQPAHGLEELAQALRLPYTEAKRIFARVYRDSMIAACGGNKTEAAERAGMSRGGFRRLSSYEE